MGPAGQAYGGGNREPARTRGMLTGSAKGKHVKRITALGFRRCSGDLEEHGVRRIACALIAPSLRPATPQLPRYLNKGRWYSGVRKQRCARRTSDPPRLAGIRRRPDQPGKFAKPSWGLEKEGSAPSNFFCSRRSISAAKRSQASAIFSN